MGFRGRKRVPKTAQFKIKPVMIRRCTNHYKRYTKSSAWRRAIRHLRAVCNQWGVPGITQCPNEKSISILDKIFVLHFLSDRKVDIEQACALLGC